jgi:hypothetical protein
MANEAFCTLIEAQMGGGKTNTVTGLVSDDYVSNMYTIASPSGYNYPVKNCRIDATTGNIVAKLDCEDNRSVYVPKDFETFSTTKIFANYHLYGVKYVYASFGEVLRFINTDIMKDSKWIIDEGWLGADARRGMSPLTILITQYAQLMRKLNIELFWLTQHARFLDWRVRYIAKRKILTKYNKDTHMIRLLIQDLVKGTEKVVSYYAPTYWRFYDTNEVPPMPTNLIKSAGKYA